MLTKITILKLEDKQFCELSWLTQSQLCQNTTILPDENIWLTRKAVWYMWFHVCLSFFLNCFTVEMDSLLISYENSLPERCRKYIQFCKRHDWLQRRPQTVSGIEVFSSPLNTKLITYSDRQERRRVHKYEEIDSSWGTFESCSWNSWLQTSWSATKMQNIHFF